jgi:excisionase family DNA binding protein
MPDPTAADVLPPDGITPTQATKLLQCHLATVYRLMDDGTLPYWTVGKRRRRISEADVRALIKPGQPKRPRPMVPIQVSKWQLDLQRKRTQEILKRHGLA